MNIELVTLGLACADVMVRPVDEFPERGKLTLVPHLEIHLGGLAAVTAATYARLGGKAAFIGAIGTDGFGGFIDHALASKKVNIQGVSRIQGAHTAATVVLVSDDGERTFLHHAGAVADLTEEMVDFELVSGARMLHWGGPAVTPGLDGEPIGRLFARAKELGLQTSIDTCYDAQGLWFARIQHALPHTDVIMTSIEEAREYSQKREMEAIADFFLSQGPGIVMIKLGPAGLYVKSKNGAFKVPAHRVNAVDTTGAGDASCGGFLFGYLRDWDLERCARLANAVGGLTVQRMGGSEGIRSLEATLAFMDGSE